MGSRIKLLSEALINQIAAGEVIDRPASVVKELIENSLDAGSAWVRVMAEQGGKRLIMVRDDGEGMSRDDALLSLERHATSKIQSTSDLFSIGTLGFRGEALPSIAAVSRMTLTARDRASESGTRIRVEAGVIKEVGEIGAGPGTTVEVHNLFYNLPARRKFLKAVDTELGHLTEAVTRMALSRPDVHFEFIHHERSLLDTPGTQEPLARIYQVLGPQAAEHLLPVERILPRLLSGRDVTIRGHAGLPSFTRTTTGSMYIFVNGRFIRDRLINHAIFEAYRNLVPKGRYPITVLYITMPLMEVDVNVHPAKFEVRFKEQGLIHQAIQETLTQALHSQGRSGISMTWAQGETEQAGADPGEMKADHLARVMDALQRYQQRPEPGPARHAERLWPSPSSRPRADTAEHIGPDKIPAPAGAGFYSSLFVIGQFHDMYLLLQSDQELVIIDQHAAHERVVFERLKIEYARSGIKSQSLMFPATVELSMLEARALAQFLPVLLSIGLEVERFSGQTWVIKAVPALLGHKINAGQLLLDLVDELVKVEKSKRLEDKLDEVFAVISCHSVVRGPRRLSHEEIRALLTAMDETEIPAKCPHGRDVVVRLPLSSLEKMFGR